MIKNHRYGDLYFMIPLAAACAVAFIRFPLLQLDDHLSVIRYISENGSWPVVSPARFGGIGLHQAGHPMLHHTLAAALYHGLEFTGASHPTPARIAQALSLFWALGTAALVSLILKRLPLDRSSRRMTLLLMGTCAGWIWTGATIGNDMALSFWSTAALLAAVVVVSKPPPLAWKPVLFLCLAVGLAMAAKDLAVLILPGAVAAVLIRKFFYRESFLRLAVKALTVLLVWGTFAAVNFYRHWRGTGGIAHYQDIRISSGLDVDLPVPRARHKSFFSFRLAGLLRRPYTLKEKERVFSDPRDYLEGDNYAADWEYQPDSVWTDLYATWWSLPDHLPNKPEPAAARLLYLTALPLSLLGLVGLARCLLKLNRPQFWPAACWSLGAAVLLLLVSYLVEVPFSHARLFSFAIGSFAVFAALGFQGIGNWKPFLKRWLWLYLFVHVAVFWYLLLSGPFYSLWPLWPNLTPI